MLNLAKPVEFSAEPNTCSYKGSIFPAWCLYLSKTKQNANMVLMRLAFPINPHQNANQKPIEVHLHAGRSVHFHPIPIYQTLFSIFQGSGSKTMQAHGFMGLCMVSCCLTMSSQLFAGVEFSWKICKLWPPLLKNLSLLLSADFCRASRLILRVLQLHSNAHAPRVGLSELVVTPYSVPVALISTFTAI